MADTQLIHVVLVAHHDPVSDWLLATLRSEANVVLTGSLSTLDRAADLIGQRPIDVLLVDTSVTDAKQLDRYQTIAATPGAPASILMVEPTDLAFVQQALFAGARGFLLKPFTQVQLMDSLRQVVQVVAQQRQALGAGMGAPAPRADSAEILALFSPKGGVGRTSLATSLAVALHQESRKRVTLVDGDLQFGDIDIAVNAVARKSIADLLGYVNDLEPSLLESALIDHPSGIRLLLAPPLFDPALEADEGRLAHVIKSLSAVQGGYVVVDAPSGLSESTLNLLDVAQRVLLVTAASVASLRATKRFLELSAKMDYPEEKIALVLSGYRKDADVPLEDIERHLARPIASVIPSDPLTMAQALNQGQPIVMRDRNHAVSKAIIKLARHLGAGTASASPARSEPSSAPAAPGSRPMSMISALRPKQALGS